MCHDGLCSFISFTVARAATLGIFWTKYSVTALISPGAYAVLREPLASDYLNQPSITQVAPVSGAAAVCQGVLTIKSDLKHWPAT
jgi:hypothetical protein